MYTIRASINYLLIALKKPRLLIICDSSLSRRYVLFNIGMATKGPSSVLYSIRDALLGVGKIHKIIDETKLSEFNEKLNVSNENEYLLLSWNVGKLDLVSMISKIDSCNLIIGPNIEINAKLVSFLVDNSNMYKKFLVPSAQVIESLRTAIPEFARVKVEVWPVGVETRKWKPSRLRSRHRDTILIYQKGVLTDKDLGLIELLRLRYPKIEVVEYGNYKPKSYLKILQKTRFAVWLGGWESQGIAMLESWSCDVPTYVRTQCDCTDHIEGICEKSKKYAPYLSQDCGIYFQNEEELLTALEELDGHNPNSLKKFEPRTWVKENLDTRIQLKSLLD